MIESARGLAQLGSGDPGAAFAHLRRVLDPLEPWHTGFIARWVLADAVEAAVLADEHAAGRELLQRAEALPRPSAHLQRLAGLRATAAVARRRARRRGARRVRGPARAARPRPALPRRPAAPLAARPRPGRCCVPRATPSRRSTSRPAPSGRAASCAPRARPSGPSPSTPRSCSRRRSCRSRGWPRTGSRNREIGQALYLSHRTIGSNLYRVFPKLGVASRGELRALLAQ